MNFRSSGQIADDMAEKIDRGDYPDGAKLPTTYRELAAVYEVSPGTAQRAYLLLRDRGLVVGRPGVGLCVADRSAAAEAT